MRWLYLENVVVSNSSDLYLGDTQMSRMDQVQFSTPAPSQLFTPAVTTILILSTLGFLISLMMPSFMTDWLALNPQRVFRGPVWQFLTYPLVFQFPMAFVFSALTILFAGSTVEREWGTKPFVALWFVVSITCALIWVLICLLMGSNYLGTTSLACCYGLIAVLGLLFRGTRMFMVIATVDARVMALIFIAIGVIQSLTAPITLIWVFGAAVGYAFARIRGKMSDARAREHLTHESYKPGTFVDVD